VEPLVVAVQPDDVRQPCEVPRMELEAFDLVRCVEPLVVVVQPGKKGSRYSLRLSVLTPGRLCEKNETIDI